MKPAATRRLGLTLAAAVCLLAPALARADNFDEELFKRTPKLLKYLKKEKGYKNVGVLKFRIQRGEAEPTFFAGPLNLGAAERLENGLVMSLDPDAAVGILHNCSRTAVAKDRKASYLSEAGRKGLLDGEYPLAWDAKARVRPDALLTGLVKFNADQTQATVTVEAFDKDNPGQLTEVCHFDVTADRSLLADVGKGFFFTRTQAKTLAVTPPQGDALRPPQNAVAEESLIRLEVLVNGQPRPITWPDQEKFRNGSLPPFLKDQKVAFKVQNPSDQKVGVVLLVNGENTLFHQAGRQPEQYAYWVLEPRSKEYVIPGLYDDMENYAPFNVLSAEESEQKFAELSDNDKLGLLQVFVLVEGGDGAPAVGEAQYSLRGLAKGLLQKDPPQSAKDLQARLRAVKPTPGKGLLSAGTNKLRDPLDKDTVKNPQLKEEWAVRYYSRGGP